jgi:hypothetical protein
MTNTWVFEAVAHQGLVHRTQVYKALLQHKQQRAAAAQGECVCGLLIINCMNAIEWAFGRVGLRMRVSVL